MKSASPKLCCKRFYAYTDSLTDTMAGRAALVAVTTVKSLSTPRTVVPNRLHLLARLMSSLVIIDYVPSHSSFTS